MCVHQHRRPSIIVILEKVWALCLAFILTGCTQYTSPPAVTPTVAGKLVYYHTPTSSSTAVPLTTLETIPLTPAPSATPFTHTVVSGDTMLGIAIKYGVTLEDLQAANPGVDPRFLSIGTVLIIPLGGEIPEVLPTATPIPVQWSPPTCYRTGEGGAWCFLLVRNTWSQGLENLSAWIGLFDDRGNNIAGQVAVPPLNRLPSGEALPLVAFFPAPLPTEFSAQSEPLTALGVAADDPRYLEASAEVQTVEIDPAGLKGKVQGELMLPFTGLPASQIWLAAVGYDVDGSVVGVRKWEARLSPMEEDLLSTDPLTLTIASSPAPATSLPFEITVYSLGPPIVRVEVLVEARP